MSEKILDRPDVIAHDIWFQNAKILTMLILNRSSQANGWGFTFILWKYHSGFTLKGHSIKFARL